MSVKTGYHYDGELERRKEVKKETMAKTEKKKKRENISTTTTEAEIKTGLRKGDWGDWATSMNFKKSTVHQRVLWPLLQSFYIPVLISFFFFKYCTLSHQVAKSRNHTLNGYTKLKLFNSSAVCSTTCIKFTSMSGIVIHETLLGVV